MKFAMVLLLSINGCVFIPKFSHPAMYNTVDAEAKVGSIDSNRPIRIHVSTRHEVEDVLGKPGAVALDNRRIVYAWYFLHGKWYYLFGCGATDDDAAAAWIEFVFDEDDVLRSTQTLKGGSWWPLIAKPTFGEPAPIPWDWTDRYPPQKEYSGYTKQTFRGGRR